MSRNFHVMPDGIAALPKDKHGRPVPKFVDWIDGEPDYRQVKPGWREFCVENNICWICSEFLGVSQYFVLGVMCCLNRTAGEPPCHRCCAEYAARMCPRLAMPPIKGGVLYPNGIQFDPNPDVIGIWETQNWEPRFAGNGTLFDIGDPVSATFWRRGRQATKIEVLNAIKHDKYFLSMIRSNIPKMATDPVSRTKMMRLDRDLRLFRQWLDGLTLPPQSCLPVAI